MLPGAHKAAYDPVPPYDLEDIEANRTVDPNNGDQINEPEDETVELTESNVQMHGELTQQQCCCFGLSYFITAVVGVALIVLIIAHYNYLTSKKSN
jgi:hypothetical protein